MRIVLLPAIALALLTTSGRAQRAPNTSSDAARLVGLWEMVEDQELDTAGQVVARDRDVVGLLVYSPDGRVAVQIMYRRGRPTVSTANDIASTGVGLGHIQWSLDEARTAIDTYDAYFGTYVVDAARGRVTHHVTGELRPSATAASYQRQYELHDDQLWLRSADPSERWRVVWRRVE